MTRVCGSGATIDGRSIADGVRRGFEEAVSDGSRGKVGRERRKFLGEGDAIQRYGEAVVILPSAGETRMYGYHTDCRSVI